MADVNIKYKGSTISEFSATSTKTLLTAGKYCESDIVVTYTKTAGSATTPAKTITANPTISINASGVITASVTGSSSITPTVSAGYVSSGTAGTVSVSGSSTYQLTTASIEVSTVGTGTKIGTTSAYNKTYVNISQGYNDSAKYYEITPPDTLNFPTTPSSSSVGTQIAAITATTSSQYLNIPYGYSNTNRFYRINKLATMTLPSKAVTTSTGTAKATITPTTSSQYLNIPTGYNSTAQYYTIPAVSPEIYRFKEIVSTRTANNTTFSIDGTPYANLTSSQLTTISQNCFGIIRQVTSLDHEVPELTPTNLKIYNLIFYYTNYGVYQTYHTYYNNAPDFTTYQSFPRNESGKFSSMDLVTIDNRPGIKVNLDTRLPGTFTAGNYYQDKYELIIIKGGKSSFLNSSGNSESGRLYSSVYPSLPRLYFIMPTSHISPSVDWATLNYLYIGEHGLYDSLGYSGGKTVYSHNIEDDYLPYYDASGYLNFGEFCSASGLSYKMFYFA